MKYLSLPMPNLLLILLLLSGTSIGYAQATDSPYFPKNGQSLHLGTSVLHSLISGNVEHYRHAADGRHHWGVGYGLSAGWGYFGLGVGAHLMGSYWSGRGTNHFEAKLGVAPTYFKGGPEDVSTLFPVPIVLLGYRRQAPGSDRFFYVHLGSVGVGVGLGRAFGGK